MVTCIDCGKRIRQEVAFPIRWDSSRAYLCKKCAYVGVPELMPKYNPSTKSNKSSQGGNKFVQEKTSNPANPKAEVVIPGVTKLTEDIWNRMTPIEREQLGIKARLDAETRGSHWIELFPEEKRALIREFRKEQAAIPKVPVRGKTSKNPKNGSVSIEKAIQVHNPFLGGETTCYFCQEVYPECPTVYTYKSRHGQPFIFCGKCHRSRYITKIESAEIERQCEAESIVVESIAGAKRIEIARSMVRATTKAGIATVEVSNGVTVPVIPLVTKAGITTVPVVVKIGTKVVPVVVEAGAKTAFGLSKLGRKTIRAIGQIGVRAPTTLPTIAKRAGVSPLSLPEYTHRPLVSMDGGMAISTDRIPLVGSLTEMVSTSNPKRITQVFLIAENPREASNPKSNKKSTKVHPLALETRARYRDDMKAGHTAAAEYWRGQAGAFFTGNPGGLYQTFHGNPPARVRQVKMRVPKKGERLVKIGRLTSVVYAPENPSKLAGRQFQHELGDTGSIMLPNKPILATSADGKQLYIINDKASPKLTERGLIG